MTTQTFGTGTFGSNVEQFDGQTIAPIDVSYRTVVYRPTHTVTSVHAPSYPATVVHAPSYSADASHLTSISKPGVHSSAARTVVYQPTYDRQGTP